VLRLNWSPDGQYIVTAHAMNGGGPTAKVLYPMPRIMKDKWCSGRLVRGFIYVKNEQRYLMLLVCYEFDYEFKNI
jgi:hypothetical protein